MKTGADAPEPYHHLTPTDVWTAQQASGSYRPEAFEADGFIHFTIGEENLLAVANVFYRSDRREYVVLTIDPTRLTAPVRFEDAGRIYPHLYGPLNGAAVVSVRPVRRAPDGSFVAIEPAPAS